MTFTALWQEVETMSRNRLVRGAVGGLSLALFLMATSHSAAAQARPFVALGGGAGLPGGGGEGMRSGWVAEAMGGVTVLDGVIGLRVGGMFARNEVVMNAPDMDDIFAPDPPNARFSDKLAVMAGGMYMPLIIGPTVPYLLGDIGLMRARYEGSANSLVWQAGAGTIVQLGAARLYVDARYLQARNGSRQDSMIPVTAGLRFGR
jgi:hypothetical protein